MHSQSHSKIEKLNKLIDEVDQLQSDYNDMIAPIIETQIEIQRHQLFFNRAKNVDEETKEAKILKDLEARLKELDSPDKKHTCEILNGKIEEAKTKIEQLWVEITGKCDRSSPSFLEKIDMK